MCRAMHTPRDIPFKALHGPSHGTYQLPPSFSRLQHRQEDAPRITQQDPPTCFPKQLVKLGLSTRLGLRDEELQIYLRTILNNGSHGKIYKGNGTTYETKIRADANRASHVRKRKGRGAASPTNPETGRAGKRKKKMQDIRAIVQPEGKHAC